MSTQYPGPPDDPYGTQPPSADPYGQPPATGSPYGGNQQSPYGATPSPTYAGGPITADRRPGTVTAAAVITWVTSGLVAALMILGIIGLSVNRDAMLDAIRDQPGYADAGIAAEDAIGVAFGLLGFLLVCSLVAIVLAVLAFRRSKVGRILLAICAGVTALVSLIGIASGLLILTLVASVTTVVLLFTGGANQWYARKADPGAYPGYA